MGAAILGLIAVIIGWILGRAPGLAERLLQDLLPFCSRLSQPSQSNASQQTNKPMGGDQGQGDAPPAEGS
jgi:hypothetical protein